MHTINLTVILMVSLVCSTLVEARPNSADGSKFFNQFIMDCKAKESATDSDVGEIMDFQLPSTKAGQCLNACVMEATGELDDGMISVEKSVAAASHYIGNDEEKMKHAKDVAVECSTVPTSLDRCQIAMEFLQCVQAGAEARGHTYKDMLSM